VALICPAREGTAGESEGNAAPPATPASERGGRARAPALRFPLGPILPASSSPVNPPIRELGSFSQATTASDADASAASGDSAFTFIRRKTLRHAWTHGVHTTVNSPSVANSGKTVLFTGNWYASVSSNGGETFEYSNPHSNFADAESRFHDDQVVVSDPMSGALFWLQTGQIEDPMAGPCDRLTAFFRLSIDRDGDGVVEPSCSTDIYSVESEDGVSLEDPDFPDLQLTDGYLWVTMNFPDVLVTVAGDDGILGTSDDVILEGETAVVRMPLPDLLDCDGTVQNDHLVSSDAAPLFEPLHSFRAVAGARDAMYFASHRKIVPAAPALPEMVVCRWPDDGAAECTNVPVPWSPNQNVGSCAGPDGRDWCARSDPRILAGYIAQDTVGFMWNVSQGGDFPFPYTQMARFDEGNLSLIDAPVAWSPDYAVMFPSVAVNARGHLGGTFMLGGGAGYPTCAAWIVDDVNPNQIPMFEWYKAYRSTSGPRASNPSACEPGEDDRGDAGDYLTTRAHAVFPNTWIGACYTIHGGFHHHAQEPSSAYAKVRPRFLWFGRDRDRPCDPAPSPTVCGDGCFDPDHEDCEPGVNACADGSACGPDCRCPGNGCTDPEFTCEAMATPTPLYLNCCIQSEQCVTACQEAVAADCEDAALNAACMDAANATQLFVGEPVQCTEYLNCP
jgi:hypothetical protein